MAQLDTHANDPYDLRRFLDAQASTFEQARSELAAGRKLSHWMWFIFPQIHGLGSSPMARRYAISCLQEATSYLIHPVLGPRLRDCTSLVNAVQGRAIGDIFGYPDELKFHSSATLFSLAATRCSDHPRSEDCVFSDAIARYFHGLPDQATLDRVQR